MAEKQITSKEKEQKSSQYSIDVEKENARAVSQLNATLNAPKKTSRLQNLRSSTSGIETLASRQSTLIRREAKAGESIDV